MPLEDKALRLRIMREIGKFNIDASRIDVKVINQVCYLGGEISRMRNPGAPTDLRKVLEQIHDDVEKMPGVTDVVDDVRFR